MDHVFLKRKVDNLPMVATVDQYTRWPEKIKDRYERMTVEAWAELRKQPVAVVKKKYPTVEGVVKLPPKHEKSKTEKEEISNKKAPSKTKSKQVNDGKSQRATKKGRVQRKAGK